MLFPVFFANAQLRYPIVGNYNGKSAQGMAIWGDEAYLFNDGGHCRVLDLKNGEVKREFYLKSSGKNTHVNAACFDSEISKNAELPNIYISEYNYPSRCFVENIKDTVSNLVQTIQAYENGVKQFVQSWIVDSKKGCLYAVARQSPVKGDKNTSKVRIVKYRLPKLMEGREVVLSEKDQWDSFFVDFSSGTQGGVIRGKYMYLPSGLQESAKGSFNAERAVQVIDLRKKKLVRRIDLTYVTTNEPEDMDFYHKKALLYCGQEGGIYEIKLK
jgi:hypothetical protein